MPSSPTWSWPAWRSWDPGTTTSQILHYYKYKCPWIFFTCDNWYDQLSCPWIEVHMSTFNVLFNKPFPPRYAKSLLNLISCVNFTCIWRQSLLFCILTQCPGFLVLVLNPPGLCNCNTGHCHLTMIIQPWIHVLFFPLLCKSFCLLTMTKRPVFIDLRTRPKHRPLRPFDIWWCGSGGAAGWRTCPSPGTDTTTYLEMVLNMALKSPRYATLKVILCYGTHQNL